jgi:hypothetical protein
MICNPCRKGGIANRLSITRPKNREVYLTTARRWHAECLGGTHCDCQHETGEWLRPEARPEADRAVETRELSGEVVERHE